MRRYQYQLKLKKVGAGAVGEIADIARLPIEIGYPKYQASLEAPGDYLRSHRASAERATAIRDLLASEHSRLAGHKCALGEENLRRRIPISRQQFPK